MQTFKRFWNAPEHHLLTVWRPQEFYGVTGLSTILHKYKRGDIKMPSF